MTAAGLKPAPPATLVIFGVTGDLARRLLVPALVNLRREGLITDGLNILGIGKQDLDDEALRRALAEFVDAGDPGWKKLRGRIFYLRGDFGDEATYRALAARLGPGNAAFYLATPPAFFGEIADRLAAHRLLDEDRRPISAAADRKALRPRSRLGAGAQPKPAEAGG